MCCREGFQPTRISSATVCILENTLLLETDRTIKICYNSSQILKCHIPAHVIEESPVTHAE